ncbi:3-deoxy-manno-octulosonate cytidylyltransferase [uncultured Thiothrix sp.]|uniref:3-deoxy-manno-octulosonate cytidylyltransferase n=1 Tax=uncultured Thiothrix sp. TaxID=223185 RepID=UPI00261B0962|nr:3-deoxy-manno-octulosonate cytidylyltransferase [uncultured Thiothrix sp.]
MKPVLVIPTRYGSTRLPAKALRLLKGKPLVQHVYERAIQAQAAFATIVVATDDQRIQEVCESFGATVCMTSTAHETGSDRLAEVVQIYGWADDQVVVNLQGDEPLTPVENLYQLANNLQTHPEAMMATLATPLQTEHELADTNIVKVVKDMNGLALYFSRAQIPFQRDAAKAGSYSVSQYALRHVGMYAYRAEFLKAFAGLEPCSLEQLEKLEQLRALYYGYRIHVDLAEKIPGPGVDTEADLRLVESLL